MIIRIVYVGDSKMKYVEIMSSFKKSGRLYALLEKLKARINETQFLQGPKQSKSSV